MIQIAHSVRIARVALVLLAAIMSASAYAGCGTGMDFLKQQKKYTQVREALLRRADALDRRLAEHGLKSCALNVLFVAYKAEAVLDIYAKAPDEANYRKLASWPICASSGKLGPKRRQRDGQVPEGFYRIDRFNPASQFHLSLGIDYPNAADRLKTRAANPGGDIFIHGSCVTVGCLPMTDAVIEEIYLYAVHARDSGQKTIPVYIFPFRMTRENMEKYEAIYRGQPELIGFWRNLKKGYEIFIEHGRALKINVMKNGDYGFAP
ncbi:MAG: L,D-transpeptidase family protein [Azoarcus sp.]|jgi:murein L,D-transpeptidase YafK|nr:L,D-transpeptidase family protein [Azoarcus sp.]